MKHAKKIQLAAVFPYLNNVSRIIGRHGMREGAEKHAVVRRYLPRKQIELVRNALPKNTRQHLMGVFYSEISLLGPHIHLDDGCTVNFYRRVNGETTSFWDGEIERDDRWSTDNGAGYIVVNPEKIKIVESFTAKDGDVWILDTKRPHSVSIKDDTRSGRWKYVPKTEDVRIVVQAYMDMPYQEFVKCFDETVAV
jgi:hypothetical protein